MCCSSLLVQKVDKIVCAKSLQCLGSLERKALNQLVMGESESRSVMSDSLRSHGLYSPWGHKESDTTEQLSLSIYTKRYVRDIDTYMDAVAVYLLSCV